MCACIITDSSTKDIEDRSSLMNFWIRASSTSLNKVRALVFGPPTSRLAFLILSMMRLSPVLACFRADVWFLKSLLSHEKREVKIGILPMK